MHVVGGVHALIGNMLPLICTDDCNMMMQSKMYCPPKNNNKISGAIILGPRVDRFRDDESKYIAGHSIPLISLGGFILTFGFMAFNAGSQVNVLDMNFFRLKLL